MSHEQIMPPTRQPLSGLVADKLRSEYCRRLQPGSRLPRERDLAQKLKVSLVTLREALSFLTWEGWIERRQGSGNYVLHPLKRGPSRIGILIEADLSCGGNSRGCLLAIALKIKNRLEEKNLDCRIYFGHRAPDNQEKHLFCAEFLRDSATLDRVVALYALVSSDWLQPLKDRGIPVIGGNTLFDICLSLDREKWIHAAVAHLLGQGIERIGLLYWGGNRPVNPGMISYGEIFATTLRRFGLPYDPRLVRSDLHPSLDGSGWEEFREIWLRNSSIRPEGLIVTDDVLLQGCLHAATELGLRVSQDLQIAALTSDFRIERDWDKITRFEWRIDQYVDLCLRALQLERTAMPTQFDLSLAVRAPRRISPEPSNHPIPVEK